MTSLPIGLTGLDPIPYGYRRWNGRVWPDVHIDEYNARLADIGARHAAGYDTSVQVEELYRRSFMFDHTN